MNNCSLVAPAFVEGWWLKQTPKTSVPEAAYSDHVCMLATSSIKSVLICKRQVSAASPVSKAASDQKRKKQKTPIKSPDPEAVFMPAAIFFI